MKFKYKLVLNFFSLLLCNLAHSITVSDTRGSVEVISLKNWRYEKNILGLPHVFLTNEKPIRSTLSLTITGIDDVKLPVEDLKKNQSDYQKGRSDWAKTTGASEIKFSPYNATLNKQKVTIHEIGLDYSLAGNKYRERTYYIECPKSLINLKYVGAQDSLEFKNAHDLVMQLKCL